MYTCTKCKYYSDLDVWVEQGDENLTHYICQAGNCVYCKAFGVICTDFEYGENNGGKLETSQKDG